MTGHSFRTTAPAEAALQFRVVHGYRRAFRLAGSGPPLVLIHGIGDSSATWIPVLGALAPRHLVIAPDLLGHGHSAKPRADHSVAAYANGVRDPLLPHPRDADPCWSGAGVTPSCRWRTAAAPTPRCPAAGWRWWTRPGTSRSTPTRSTSSPWWRTSSR
jgi:pimeloyl-ACP methyl ester carboxylesterase